MNKIDNLKKVLKLKKIKESEKEKAIRYLQREIEFYKQKQLLAVIFFDGENRQEIKKYEEKRKEAEEMLQLIEAYEVD